MKKALRIIIPILLALILIACSAWYLLVYDRAFTRDLLLQQARSFESMGNHKMAAWLYDVAYYQSSNDDDVAIELAEQYKAIGNYTKAEYTLSQAIAEKSSAALYKALCATYVEQDKLLDAVTMLDSISDPAIKAELDAQRPAMPTVSPEPGYYSQYISVTVNSSEGTLYVSTKGEYPSTADAPYTAPITLPGGETMLYAVAVGDDLLVSPLGKYGFTVGGVIEQVTFADAAMEAAIRAKLGVGESEVLFTDALWTITEFTVPEGVQNYTDLARLTYLQSLTAKGVPAGQLSGISVMSGMETLSLTECKLDEADLSAIGSLVNLKNITMQNCSVSTISALSGLKKVAYFDLSGNTVRNISPISGMTGLEELNLSGNAVTDIGALTPLSLLKKLNISYNSITSIDQIATLTSLVELDASHNQIASVPSMGTLTALTNLNLSHNAINDVSLLADCASLLTLDVSNNKLTDISALNALKGLNKLVFAYNEVTALPAFPEDAMLVTIDGSHNLINSLEPLGKLQKLNNVLMDYNAGLESLKPLDGCPLLVMVNAYGTKVKEVTFLTQKSVIVNFNPST